MVLFWHRRDLRITDNAGLFKALKENEQVQPVFIFDGKPPSLKQNVLDSRKSIKSSAKVDLEKINTNRMKKVIVGFAIGGLLPLVIFVLLGLVNILNSYTATFVITNNAGQEDWYEISILEKGKVQEFVNEVNTTIAEL